MDTPERLLKDCAKTAQGLPEDYLTPRRTRKTAGSLPENNEKTTRRLRENYPKTAGSLRTDYPRLRQDYRKKMGRLRENYPKSMQSMGGLRNQNRTEHFTTSTKPQDNCTIQPKTEPKRRHPVRVGFCSLAQTHCLGNYPLNDLGIVWG